VWFHSVTSQKSGAFLQRYRAAAQPRRAAAHAACAVAEPDLPVRPYCRCGAYVILPLAPGVSHF
jgi:hypothetical protein